MTRARSPRALRVYMSAVIAAGGAVLAVAIPALLRVPQPLLWIALAGLGVVTGTFTMKMVPVSATVSVDDTFFMASAMLFGPAPATVTIAINTGIVSWRRHHPWPRVAFNVAAPAIAMGVASRAFFAFAGVPPIAAASEPVVRLIGPLICLTVIYFFLNSGFAAVAIGLDTATSPLQVWRRHFMWLGVGYSAAASVALSIVLLIEYASVVATVIVLPLLVIFHLTLRSSFGRLEDARRHLAHLDRLYRSTVETLAMAIDAKDDVTHNHVRRVQAYAVGLARALDVLDDTTLKAIEAAALLHDTGKLAVPEHILNKPGRLTPDEFEKMKLHVDVGADILSLVEFPYPVVPIVRGHHENWDGSGYPRGLKGEEIPLGARILSVVDCFDALTSDRPYRAALTDTAALDILRERRDRMYDPRVVDTFIRVYREIPLDGVDAPEHRAVMRQIARSRVPDVPPPVAGAPSHASDGMLAFVSLARLATGDAGVADVLALASPLVAEMMPDATIAWYVRDASRDVLTAVEAAGPAADLVRGLTMTIGDRVSGWVAASRQIMVNAAAVLDLGERARRSTPPVESCLALPLVDHDAVVGVLCLYRPGVEAFCDNDGRLLQMIAPQMAHAIAHAQRRAVPDSGVTEKAVGSERDLRLIASR